MLGKESWVIIALCLAAGCAAESHATRAADSQATASASTLELQGSWRGLCNDDGNGGSFSRKLAASGDSLVYQQFWYSGASCTNLDSAVTLETEVQVGGSIAGHPSAHQLDEHIVAATMDVLSQNAADRINAISTCGHSNWQVGDSIDMSECGSETVSLVPGGTIYAAYVRASESELHLSDGTHGPMLSMALQASDRPASPHCDGYCAYFRIVDSEVQP